jgi:hypothetical protein
MLFLQQPPDTSAYMIAGYVVIFGSMLAYVVSLIIRRRNLEQDIQVLQELESRQQGGNEKLSNSAMVTDEGETRVRGVSS